MATIRAWPRFEVLEDPFQLLAEDSPQTAIVSTWAFAQLHTYYHVNFPDGILPPNIYPTTVFRALSLSPNHDPLEHPITNKWRAARNQIYKWAAAARTSRHWRAVVSSSVRPTKIPGIGTPSEMAALHALFDNALPAWLHQLWSLLNLDWVLDPAGTPPPFWHGVQFTRIGTACQHAWDNDPQTPATTKPDPTTPKAVNTLLATIHVVHGTRAHTHSPPLDSPTTVLATELPTVMALLRGMSASTPKLSSEVATLLARTLEHDRRRMDALEAENGALRQDLQRCLDKCDNLAEYINYKFGEVDEEAVTLKEAVQGLDEEVEEVGDMLDQIAVWGEGMVEAAQARGKEVEKVKRFMRLVAEEDAKPVDAVGVLRVVQGAAVRAARSEERKGKEAYRRVRMAGGFVTYFVEGREAECKDTMYVRGGHMYVMWSYGPLEGCEHLLGPVPENRARWRRLGLVEDAEGNVEVVTHGTRKVPAFKQLQEQFRRLLD